MNNPYIVRRKFQTERHRLELSPFLLVELTENRLMRGTEPRSSLAAFLRLMSEKQAMLVIASHRKR